MRNWDPRQGFVDIGDGMWPMRPDEIVRAANVGTKISDRGDIIASADKWMKQPPRKLIFKGPDNTKYIQWFTPYVHPVGAGSLVIGAVATDAAGRVTYTPAAEGLLLSKAGALVVSADPPVLRDSIAGMLLTDYYEVHTMDSNDREFTRVVSIEEGDFMWLGWRGRFELFCDVAINDGDHITASSTAAGGDDGKVALSTVISIANVTALFNTLVDHMLEYKMIGYCRETIANPGLCMCDLHLQEDYDELV